MASPAELSHRIKQKAKELNIDFIGIAKAEFLAEEAPKLEKWLNAKAHGEMSWMENHFDKRLDPTKLIPGTRSVISIGINYLPKETQREGTYKVSKYAYGRDYHKVLKGKMKKLLAWMRDEIGDIQGRAFVDSAPIMDKAWAKRSGIGWMGKHTNILNRQAGSFFFLGELLIDIELAPDAPVKDHCGTCTRCIDACPTNAIEHPYGVNGSKCISYLTIELKSSIPSDFKGLMDDWIFGCDVCQDVCPWNKKAPLTQLADFSPKDERLLQFKDSEWEEITEEVFKDMFYGTPVKRTGFKGLKRNITFIKKETPSNEGASS